MIPLWPPTLPQYPLQDGLNIEALDNIVRAETGTGPGLDRASELADWYQVRCTVSLRSDAERDLFQRWRRNELVRGSQIFSWPAMDRLIGDTEAGFNLKFTAQPKTTKYGVNGWRVAMELISLPAAPPVALIANGELQ